MDNNLETNNKQSADKSIESKSKKIIIIILTIILIASGITYFIIKAHKAAEPTVKKGQTTVKKEQITAYKEQIFNGVCSSIEANKLTCDFGFKIDAKDALITISVKFKLSEGLEIVSTSSSEWNLKVNEDLSFTATAKNKNGLNTDNKIMTITIQANSEDNYNNANITTTNIIAKTKNKTYSFANIDYSKEIEKIDMPTIDTITNQLCEIKGVSDCKYHSGDQSIADVKNYFEITISDDTLITDIYDKIYSESSESQNELPYLWEYGGLLKINANISKYKNAGYTIIDYHYQTDSALEINGKSFTLANLDSIKLIDNKYLAIEYSDSGFFTDFTIVDNSLNELARVSSYNGSHWVENGETIVYYYNEAGEHSEDNCNELSTEQLNKVASTDGYIEYKKGAFVKKTTHTYYYKDVCYKEDSE